MTVPREELRVGYSARRTGATKLARRTVFGTMLHAAAPLPLVFWQSNNRREPVRDWLKNLDLADKKVMGRDLAKVQYGWPIGLPLCRALRDGLWEVRSSLASRREARVILCFRGGKLIALHAFFKNTRTTPSADLELALQRMRNLG